MGRLRITDKRICYGCGSDKTYTRKNGWLQWYNVEGKWYCNKCYNKFYLNPKQSKALIYRSNSRRIHFKDKYIHLKENPRKGVCCFCGKKKGELFTNNNGKQSVVITGMHHFAEYHEDDPLNDTIELCASCHGTEGRRLAQLKRK